jgi:transcriptional regulator of acetoin/glycerol metabolism
MALQLYQAQTGSVRSICSHLGIARRTFYRYVATQCAQQQRGG